MDRDKLLDRTKKDLRSVLISAPRGVALNMLLKDFKQVLGSELPFRQLGFRSVEEFLRTAPDVVRIDQGITGLTCYAVADASTSQIARFVALQKKPKLKKSGLPPAVRKPVMGFTKKSKFGPKKQYSSPRGGGGGFFSYSNRSAGGAKYGGSVYPGGPPRQNRPSYSYGKGEGVWLVMVCSR